jgi:hypothetical protein
MVEGAQDADQLKNKIRTIYPRDVCSILFKHYNNDISINPALPESALSYGSALSNAEPEYVIVVCREILAERNE